MTTSAQPSANDIASTGFDAEIFELEDDGASSTARRRTAAISIRIGVGAATSYPAQQVDQVPAPSASGIEHAHAGHDAARAGAGRTR